MQTHVQAPAPASTEQTRQQQHQPEYETDSAQLLRTPQFEDGRPEVTAQLNQQSLMANSPRTTQLKAMQAMMANSPRVSQLQATQAMMAASPRVQQLKTSQSFIAAGTLAKQNHHASAAPITQRMEDEEPLQSMAEEPVQREQTETSATDPTPQDAPPSETPKPNSTGLPDHLKTGIENLSGISMDHVKVHYNSDKPAQLQAHAYAQGSEIHVAPGQEKHLPHEAWHVVQQAQGRVKPTVQMKGGVPVNDDVGLEAEADLMGAKALQMMNMLPSMPLRVSSSAPNSSIQYMRFNLAGVSIQEGEANWDDPNTAVMDEFDTWLQDLARPVCVQVFNALSDIAEPTRDEAIAKSKVMLKISDAPVQDSPNPLMQSIPENQWWKLFIDKGAQAAGDADSANALRFDNESSPGYLAAMMASFGEHVANAVPGNRAPINAGQYANMHTQVAAGTLKKHDDGFIQMPQARSGMNTSFGVFRPPVNNVDVADINLPSLTGFREMTAERLAGTRVDMPQGAVPAANESSSSKYNYKARAATNARGAKYNPITRINGLETFRVNTNYAQDDGAALIQGILDGYYLQVAEADTTTAKLQAIVKAIRALHVGHFFEDANGRLNTMTLLNKFLIEEGLQPVIMDSTTIFGGGFSIDQLIGQVVRGMRSFGEVAGIAKNALPAVEVRRNYAGADATFVFAEEVVDEEIGLHVQKVRYYTVRYVSLPLKAQEIIGHYGALAKHRDGDNVTGKLSFTDPETAERLEHQLEPQILF